MRLPDLDEDGWTLVNAEEVAASRPGALHIPPRRVREILRPGDQAKLGLVARGAPSADKPEGALQMERLWVVVAKRIDGRYLGRLTGMPPGFAPGPDAYLRTGCEIPFAPEHVMDAIPKQDIEGDPLTDLPPPARPWA